ncbi:TonB-dependent receptor [Sphingomonas sp. RHCKR7]|uniref:TonB-dependent receptor domain-containing protein n=1 Tax=Sphingomonas folli TaxID=2862497 RepID=UPI001CA5369C|nr:TonB-dependent receptor [Sphingomonas folli]MBW6526329.1 TonB-dependent receptor [Sphingomonas folli]
MLNAYRSRLLTSTLLISAAVIAAPATAQTADPASQPKTGVQSTDPNAPAAGVSSQEAAPPAGETSSGDIVVTGTLIRNPNLVSSSPVTVVGQEEITLRQKNTAEELLRDLPGLTPSIGSAVNNGNGGASYVDLRGLGNFRNVVLLDGARIAPSGLVGRVDLNNIPLALVERVDSLTGGAAVTYGADAVSGVVNFITRSDFSGVEASVSNSITERGDGAYFRADLTVGANFDDGRGNAVFSIGYQQADPVYQGARDFSRNNYTSTSGGIGGSGTTIPSRFTGAALGTGTPTNFDDPNYLSANRIYNPTTGALRGYTASRDAFNFNPYNIFQTPFERFNMYGAGHYDISDSIQVYSRGLFSKNTVTTVLAPAGLFGESLTINLNNPYLPSTVRQQFCALNVAPVGADGTRSAYTPRFTPAECAAAATATGPNDPNYRTVNSTVARRTTEAGSRITDYTTQIFDYRAGVKIGLTEKIGLDLTGAYGESQNDQVITGYLRRSRIQQALLANSTTACIDASNNCVPINLFGPEGSINSDMLGFVTADSQVTTKTSLAQARALLSGDFGATLPWASEPIGFAAGAEYRKYRASQTADILSQQAGELSGTGGATPNVSGGYEVKEAYGELIAPLVADAPFFKSLTVEGGIRYSDYKVFAAGSPSYNSTTYKGGGSWEPVDGIKLRGNYQRAVRAPNISELFSPQNTGLTSLSADPCAGTAPSSNANLRAICIAQGAPAGTIGIIEQPSASQINATTGGNLNLKPEKSDSYTIGLVLQPRFVPGLSITVDYYNIKIQDAISQPTVSDAIAACFGNITSASAASAACTQIRRNPDTGGLDGSPATTPGLLLAASNLGTIKTDGIDLNVNYRRDLGFAKINLSFQGNWTNRAEFQATPTSVNRECIGYYSVNCGSPGSAGPSSAPGSLQPEFTWNQRTTFSFGPADISLLWRHLSGLEAEPGDDQPARFVGNLSGGALDGVAVDFSKIKAFNYFDLATRVGVGEQVDLTLTVTNLFDKQPPLVGGSIGSVSFNSGNTYPSTYDALGRRFTVGARFKF